MRGHGQPKCRRTIGGLSPGIGAKRLVGQVAAKPDLEGRSTCRAGAHLATFLTCGEREARISLGERSQP